MANQEVPGQHTKELVGKRSETASWRLRIIPSPVGPSSQNHEPQPPVQRDHLPKPSAERLSTSLTETPFDLDCRNSTSEIARESGTVLYLAYGSNLCYQTFQKSRGIKPLAQVNVLVPELRLTFDLPGIPYAEPCFANTARRDPKEPKSSSEYNVNADKEKKELEYAYGRKKKPKYHKDRWTKGLVGVVYEVTASDYAHIIETEGGGASYQDILVSCYCLPDDASVPVPSDPDVDDGTLGKPFKAHTLFNPPVPPSKLGKPPKPGRGGRLKRPDPSYAQASARYLKLICDGADEHDLPMEYKAYLRDIRPYTIASQAQRLGQFVFLSLWGPFIMLLFALNRLYSDERGRAPKWLVGLSNSLFTNAWRSYDGWFKGMFGDGERTDYKRGDAESDGELDGERGMEKERRPSLVEKMAAWSGKRKEGDEELARLEDLVRESVID